MASKKRTIDAFFGNPKSSEPTGVDKKTRIAPSALSVSNATTLTEDHDETTTFSTHPTYPFPIADLPPSIASELPSLPSSIGRAINDQPDLDLLYFSPYIPAGTERQLFTFLRASLPFYRVEYDIKRGGTSTHIRTPRWTTVFGLDATSRFHPDTGDVVDATTGRRVVGDKLYGRYPPRPIPGCLDALRRSCERATGCEFNFCLVNYYADGRDSISYHSDDERFLGPLPAIASFSLGSRRDFLMKHKPPPPQRPKTGAEPPKERDTAAKEAKPLKLPLASGDMVLMRGTTQANWLHSIPKRTGKNENDGGRINITFRKAMVKGGTENYYNYNVGTGPLYRWDRVSKEMKPWNPSGV